MINHVHLLALLVISFVAEVRASAHEARGSSAPVGDRVIFTQSRRSAPLGIQKCSVEITMRILAAAVSICLFLGAQSVAPAAPGDEIYAPPERLVSPGAAPRLNF